MGCLNDRESMSPEETVLSRNERFLCFHINDATEFDLTVRKFCSGEIMNTNQFEKSFRSLGLPTKAINANKYIPDYYKQYLDKGGWVKNKLLVLGIMHARGEVDEKLSLLYDVADAHSENEALASDLEALLADMLTTSITFLSKLIPESQRMKSKPAGNYLVSLEKKIPTALQYLKSVIIKEDNSLTKDAFLDRIRRAGLGKIADSTGLREVVISLNEEKDKPVEKKPPAPQPPLSRKTTRLKTVVEINESNLED